MGHRAYDKRENSDAHHQGLYKNRGCRKTRLAGGQQVWKDSLRVEAYGTVDELNASVGVVRVMNADMTNEHRAAQRLEEELRWVQNKLFDVEVFLRRRRGRHSRICRK